MPSHGHLGPLFYFSHQVTDKHRRNAATTFLVYVSRRALTHPKLATGLFRTTLCM
jgi:hypothetical protein